MRAEKGATELSSLFLQNPEERLSLSFVLESFAQKVPMTDAAGTAHSSRVTLIARSVLINTVALAR
jgi:hypothetical protein